MQKLAYAAKHADECFRSDSMQVYYLVFSVKCGKNALKPLIRIAYEQATSSGSNSNWQWSLMKSLDTGFGKWA